MVLVVSLAALLAAKKKLLLALTAFVVMFLMLTSRVVEWIIWEASGTYFEPSLLSRLALWVYHLSLLQVLLPNFHRTQSGASKEKSGEEYARCRMRRRALLKQLQGTKAGNLQRNEVVITGNVYTLKFICVFKQPTMVA
ncbi:hypothetical protein MMC14_002935 [Varicellaria rhodocarpa]|nr:hypothetical protein [Varicellaria rhodocarpa]